MPVYTFDLNASDIEDILTIKGLKKEEGLKIIAYRKENGFFNSLEEIKNIPEISAESINKILNCKFDQKYFEEIQRPGLSYKSLLWAPIKSLLIRILVYFAIIFSIIYFFFIHKEKPLLKRTLAILLKYLLFWILFVLTGFTMVILSEQALQIFILGYAFIILSTLFFYRKNKIKRKRTLFAMSLMCLLIIISII